MPNPSMTQMSNSRPAMAKEPTAHNTRMMGTMTVCGTCNTRIISLVRVSP